MLQLKPCPEQSPQNSPDNTPRHLWNTLLKVIFSSRTAEQVSQHFLPNFSWVTVSPLFSNQSVILLKRPGLSGSSLWFAVATSFHLSPPASSFCLIHSPPSALHSGGRSLFQEDMSTRDIIGVFLTTQIHPGTLPSTAELPPLLTAFAAFQRESSKGPTSLFQ